MRESLVQLCRCSVGTETSMNATKMYVVAGVWRELNDEGERFTAALRSFPLKVAAVISGGNYACFSRYRRRQGPDGERRNLEEKQLPTSGARDEPRQTEANVQGSNNDDISLENKNTDRGETRLK